MLTFPSTTIWFIIAILLMVSELIIPGFIIFFFGVGAALAGILTLCCNSPFWMELLVFLCGSLITLFAFRHFFPRTFAGNEKNGDLPADEDEFAGESATVVEEITPDKEGKVFFHGTTWTGKSTETLPKNSTVLVVKRQNITLIVKSK